jgi:hypothetical protein
MIRGSNKSVGDGVVVKGSGGDASSGEKSLLLANVTWLHPAIHTLASNGRAGVRLYFTFWVKSFHFLISGDGVCDHSTPIYNDGGDNSKVFWRKNCLLRMFHVLEGVIAAKVMVKK